MANAFFGLDIEVGKDGDAGLAKGGGIVVGFGREEGEIGGGGETPESGAG